MTQNPAFMVARFIGRDGSPIATTPRLMRFDTRSHLVAWVRGECRRAGLPDNARRQIDLVEVWRWIQTYGSSSCVSFGVANYWPGGVARIEFVCMTEAQYRERAGL